MNQTEGPVTVSEGALLTLNCTYQTASLVPYLFWYVQHLNKAPQLLLKGLTADKKVEHEGFQATLVKTDSSFHLQKRAVQASDSAVYYCALSDTVTQGCRGSRAQTQSADGALAVGSPARGVVSLSRGTVKALPALILRAKDLGILGLSYRGIWGRTV